MTQKIAIDPEQKRRYSSFHARRIEQTMSAVGLLGGRSILELGGHPWVMTEAICKTSSLDLVGTVSAEEISNWPDPLPVESVPCELTDSDGKPHNFTNYSANLERTLFDVDVQPDVVLACEIIEHLTRAPHVMLLNINRWLSVGGGLVLTTPNGSQFNNPFRTKSSSPAYRASTYSRHNHVFTLENLVDLIELCGFEIVVADCRQMYKRTGPSSLYSVLATIPGAYMKTKFCSTLYVVARKKVDCEELPRCPKAYAPSPDWEYIAPT